MKAIRLPITALRPVALSLALLGAGLAFTTTAPTARAESIGAAGSALVAADGSRVDAGDAPAAVAGSAAAAAARGDRGPRADRMRGHGPHRGHAPFASLQLTDAQRDKMFEVRHAQAPALRAQMKELRAARTELRTLAMSDRYDETRAAALTDRAAKAQASIALLQARSANEFYKVLTPEQRQKLEAQRAQRGDFHGRRG